MAFFLIVPSVVIVSVLVVHALANRLGLRIYYTTLFAVAVLSFMVTLATTFVTPSIGREFLLQLGLMISAAAALLTLANKFLLNRQLAEEKRFDEEVKAAYEEEKKKSSTKAAPIDKFEWGDDSSSLDAKNFLPKEPATAYNVALDAEEPSTADNVSLDAKEPSTADDVSLEAKEPSTADDVSLDAKEPSTADDVSLDVKEPSTADDVSLDAKEPSTADDVSLDAKEPSTADDVSLDAKEPSTALKVDLEPVESFPLEKVFEALPEIKSEDADKPIKLEDKKESEEEFPLEEVFKPLPTVKPEEVDMPTKQPVKPKEVKRTEFFPLQEVFRPLSTLKLEKLEKLEESAKEESPGDEPKSIDNDTLDEIVDKAYNERDKGHVWQAIDLYKKALERYRNDDYAPFVAIDLGNLYKEQALYSKAIKIYEEALMLPAVKRNASTKKDFANNLGYLRIVRDVLLKHHMLSTPFDKLSRETLQEVDTEFKKVQINSAQSK